MLKRTADGSEVENVTGASALRVCRAAVAEMAPFYHYQWLNVGGNCLTWLAVVCGALSLATPALAAPADAEGRQMVAAYAQCLMDASPRSIDRFLRLAPETPEAAQIARRRPTYKCIELQDVRFGPMVLRGSLYDILYTRDFRGAAPFDAAALPRIDYARTIEGDAAAVARQVDYLQFADCVIRADPASTRAVLASEIASREEAAAFAALRPAMGACIPGGRAFVVTRAVARGLIAETMYRMSATVVHGGRGT